MDAHHPGLNLDDDLVPREVFRLYWREREHEKHFDLVDWVGHTQESMKLTNLAVRVQKCLEHLDEIEILSLREFTSEEDDLFFEWAGLCNPMTDELARRVAGWIDEANNRALSVLAGAKDWEGVERAADSMDRASDMWVLDHVHPEVYHAFDRLAAWNGVADCFVIRKLEAELVSDMQNTKGRVKQRNISKRMMKKFEALDTSYLPPFAQSWAESRLDFWKTQFALLSLPE